MQVGSFGGLADELETLKRDKNLLMVELVRMRQHQQVRKERFAPPTAFLQPCDKKQILVDCRARMRRSGRCKIGWKAQSSGSNK